MGYAFVAGGGEEVGGEEGEEADSLASARRHLEDGVAWGIEGALEVPHVDLLLVEDEAVGEDDRQSVYQDPHPTRIYYNHGAIRL
jgi:hypothetical protein